MAVKAVGLLSKGMLTLPRYTYRSSHRLTAGTRFDSRRSSKAGSLCEFVHQTQEGSINSRGSSRGPESVVEALADLVTGPASESVADSSSRSRAVADPEQ
jgi:hypothetical protein